MKFWCTVCIFGILQFVCTYPDQHKPILREKSCFSYTSYRETEKVPYLETYKHKITDALFTNYRQWNFRNEYHPAVRKEKICCYGYKETNDSMCEPICESPCGNGTCLFPRQCICDAGYSIEFFAKNKFLCQPVCPRNCEHGKCTAPETCTCDDGYSLTNDSYVCAPVCSQPCGKEFYCAEPDHCVCLPGYEEETVINSNISSTSENRTIRICKPMCTSKCVNGECDDYNTCVCHDGYEPDPHNLFVCKPKCENGCNFGTCTAPNVCICDDGYAMNKTALCQPVCKEDCVNGTCVAPDICECFRGFGLDRSSKYICKPVCIFPCVNGKCVAPDSCECDEGFRPSPDIRNDCEPHCDTPCKPFSRCKSPNKCECIFGYRLVNKTQTKEVVGNDTSDSGWLCEPICPKCDNGFCKKPFDCQCNEGYRFSWPLYTMTYHIDDMQSKSHCQPICEPSCKNGKCIQPNVCDCDPGYSLSTHSANECDPVCNPTCNINEICAKPDSCTCKNNYYRKITTTRHVSEDRLSFECLPMCKVHCGDGKCIAPDLCECPSDYQNAKGGGCEPVCEMCNNGICVAPGVCKCHHGWTGVNCDQHTICILILNNDESYSRTLKFPIEEQNATIEHIFMNNPMCPECINDLNNETLCFKMHITDRKDAVRIGCLIDTECSDFKGLYRGRKKIMKPIIIYFAILIPILGALAIRILLRKYRKHRQQYLDTRNAQSKSMQGLIEGED